MAAQLGNGAPPAVNHHILTLDQCRREALAEIDNPRETNFKFLFQVCGVAGLGFFTNAYVIHACTLQLSHLCLLVPRYDIFTVEIASQMLGYVVGIGQVP